MPSPELRPAVFLDRDGLLNELVFYPDTLEWESPRLPDDLHLIPGAAQAIAGLQRAGWPVFLVSNQPSCAKGKTTMAALQAVHARLVSDLGKAGAALDGAYYCFHHPDGVLPPYSGLCQCRKPSPFMVREAAKEHGLDLPGSWLIGDQDTDLLCGRAAGCRTILVPCAASSSKRGTQTPDFLCTDLASIFSILGRPSIGQIQSEESPW